MLLSFLKSMYDFMCMGISPTCVSVYLPLGAEEDIRSPRTVVRDSLGVEPVSSGREGSAHN